MNRLLVMAGLSAAIAASLPGAGTAQTATCPEVESAKQAYLAKLSALKLNDGDIRPPGTLASARREESPRSAQQAPRGDQSAQQAPRSTQQAPRDQSTQQAPRGDQSTQQAPRGDQGVQQAPRGDQSAQQAPRSTQQAPRGDQSVQQAPRGDQSAQQAPRDQSVQQAPRGDQSVQQAPRGDQSVQQAPRTARQQAPRAQLEKAKGLIADADASCRAGNAADAAKKANAALRLLK